MTIKELKNLKKGDKFFVSTMSGIPADILNKIKPHHNIFSIIELTYIDCLDEEGKNAWTHTSDGEEMCWFNVEFQGVLTTSHTLSLQESASLNRDEAQRLAIVQNFYLMGENSSTSITAREEILDEYLEEYPEYFV